MKSNLSDTHNVSYGTYILVWFGLISLTTITVSVSGLNLGLLTLAVALMIASAKTLMVVYYFMHIKFDPKVFKIFALVCLLILAIVLILTFSDYLFR